MLKMRSRSIVFFVSILVSVLCPRQLSAQIVAESRIDWIESIFMSRITLDIHKAGIYLPAGKSAAINKVKMKIPILVKDPLLSLNLDSRFRLGDMILQGSYSLEDIARIMDAGQRSAGVFMNDGKEMIVDHRVRISSLANPLIKHRSAYIPEALIETTASRAYSGIIIDARGSLPVHGEFDSAKAEPCFFPVIRDDQMNTVYERNMVSPENAMKSGIVHYDYSDDESRYADRVGRDPLHIKARKIYGLNRTDPVITHTDMLKIFSVPENRALLKAGKVVILLNRENLILPVGAPRKDENFYFDYGKLKEHLDDFPIRDVEMAEVYNGIQIVIENLQFEADSARLITADRSRVNQVATSIKELSLAQGYVVEISGHTARIGIEEGEMQLSLARANAVVDALVAQGLPRNIFSAHGYGGTVPIADNASPAGRTQNRRVEILIKPAVTYMQRD
ncbi:MAG: OmpA family protein [Treponemataceae bacterium]|nr:MAG: OmpA family protein [Treponemataceae bacterium]